VELAELLGEGAELALQRVLLAEQRVVMQLEQAQRDLKRVGGARQPRGGVDKVARRARLEGLHVEEHAGVGGAHTHVAHGVGLPQHGAVDQPRRLRLGFVQVGQPRLEQIVGAAPQRGHRRDVQAVAPVVCGQAKHRKRRHGVRLEARRAAPGMGRAACRVRRSPGAPVSQNPRAREGPRGPERRAQVGGTHISSGCPSVSPESQERVEASEPADGVT
jgi:hypothetical protein